jgi:hypothetical protein
MQLSAIPAKFAIPFANSAGSGYIRAIPQASQIGVTNGAASLTDGFPPLTFLPVGAGGTPPWGQDFNGILNQITQWNQWQAAGGLVPYDSTFATAIGGYPSGAIVVGSTPGQLWLNLVDNNTSNPNSGGSNWLLITTTIATGASGVQFSSPGTFNWTCPAGVVRVRARVWGGGGGGGGGFANAGVGGAGAGGSGGGYSEGYFNVVPATVYVVTVGAAGAGGSSPLNGTAGGTSSFSTFISATGGAGGAGGNNSGSPPTGSPGTGSGGYINVTGNFGAGGGQIQGTTIFIAGGGGGAYASSNSYAVNNSSPGVFPGGAGGGAAVNGNGGFNGGNGANGFVILEW